MKRDPASEILYTRLRRKDRLGIVVGKRLYALSSQQSTNMHRAAWEGTAWKGIFSESVANLDSIFTESTSNCSASAAKCVQWRNCLHAANVSLGARSCVGKIHSKIATCLQCGCDVGCDVRLRCWAVTRDCIARSHLSKHSSRTGIPGN